MTDQEKNIKIFEDNFTEVLNIIAQGETVYYAMAQCKLEPTFLAWVFADDSRKAIYEEAQKVAAEVLAHKMLALTHETPEPEDQYMISVKQKIYEKLMEKWNTDRYGPKKQVEQTVTLDITEAMERAQQRVLEHNGKTH